LATVHVDQGAKMRPTIMACKDGVKVLGVTVLTHLGPDDLEAMGIAPEYARNPAKLVLLRAKLAKEAGCDGVVCAGTEARAVKDAFGKDFLVVCPAIRPAWSVVAGDDQTRITTPAQAIKAGADYLVVGRPIRKAENPVEAARKVVVEIAEALR
jgi:orotidine-5'-phosphate decarboxylase